MIVLWDATTLCADDTRRTAFPRGGARLRCGELPDRAPRPPAGARTPRDEAVAPQAPRRGWIAPHWPKEYGGMGATLTQQIILYRGDLARSARRTPYRTASTSAGPLIMRAGTPEQKARHLPPILSGDAIWCQGYSEPNAGSDLASLTTRAELDGDHFVVNGQKIWTTNGHYADWMFALVRTDRPRAAACRHQHAAHRPEVARHHAAADPDRSAATRNSPRSSSTTCGCRRRTCSASSTAAGGSPTSCSARSASPPAIRATRPCCSTRPGR